MKLPKALSKGEETFALHCKAYGLEPVREYRFAAPRRWRFDFAFPDVVPPLAVEIEGGTWTQGRHSRGKGMESDMQKYNAATEAGYRLLRFSTGQVERGEAIESVLRVLGIGNQKAGE